MKFLVSKVTFILLISLVFLSCERPKCDTDNAIFLNNDVTSNAYQTEVAKHIESIGIKNLRFWLADYIEKDSNHYFIFYTQGEGLCAKTMVKVDVNDQDFADILKTKGKGRFNAEFKGLTFQTTMKKLNIIEFEYTGHQSIID